ncbi:MAG TPA: PucR family transcriptional regulator ligand-binding domain-containing protein [Actinomycetota bacterium]|nr:PucR family transcriptional regulator ligand-binding domain-containing protein [Actinomycetota bacterium]
MAVAVADIVRNPALGLSLVAGRAGARAPIRWVHVSELEDPTPFLRGGELLLTTGMGLGETPARQRAYVARLVKAGLSGLGFGTGFGFPTVPRAVASECERHGFPVFEVPYEIPFIAITEAVFTRLVAEQYEELQRSVEAQQVLTRAVLEGGGIPGLVRTLAALVKGWAVVLDLHGLPLAAAPAAAEVRAPRLWEELRESRPEGTGFSLSLADLGHHVAVQPVGAGHVEAFLAVGKRKALTHVDRLVAAHALSLLAIELDKARAVAEAERALRGDLLEALWQGALGPEEVERGLRRFGFRPGSSVRGIAVAPDGAPAGDVEWALADALSRRRGGFLTSVREDTVFALIEGDAGPVPADLRRDVARRSGADVTVATGSDAPAAEAGRSIREATYALRVCRVEGRREAGFAELGSYRLLLSMQDPDALRAFADSVLGPLEAYDLDHHGDLVASLEVFLERNAKWEHAAADLFVHRHTLRYRMHKVEELTGRDLALPHDRIEFWLALRARELLATLR